MNAYRFKKVKVENHPDSTPVFIQKVLNELRKMPPEKAERVCKSFIILTEEINKD